jgi:hypothetical protein
VGRTVVSGKKLDRVFHILAPATVEISGLTIQDGRGPWGAGIWNRGTLTLRRVHIVKNGPVFDPDEPGSCNGDGVGIENWGTLVMLDSSIERNRGCRRDYSYGGGLANYGAATLTNVTVAGNRSHVGGGILNTGVLALTNVTLAFNSAISPFVLATAGMGGGLMNGGTVQILNTTITRNRASNRDYSGGGGVDNRFTSSALVTFQNSIIAGNTYPDCAGASSIDSTPVPGRMTSLGHNLRGTSTCPILAGGADLTGVGPRLRPARGTFPALFALAPGSPAIDAGDDASCPATDARGVARPQDGNGDGIARCDLGAYEVAP